MSLCCSSCGQVKAIYLPKTCEWCAAVAAVAVAASVAAVRTHRKATAAAAAAIVVVVVAVSAFLRCLSSRGRLSMAISLSVS